MWQSLRAANLQLVSSVPKGIWFQSALGVGAQKGQRSAGYLFFRSLPLIGALFARCKCVIGSESERLPDADFQFDGKWTTFHPADKSIRAHQCNRAACDLPGVQTR